MPLNAQQLAAQKNLSYVLAEKLAQRILKGEYAPGAILPGEIELGDQFGVSRTAVREADILMICTEWCRQVCVVCTTFFFFLSSVLAGNSSS